MVRIADGGREAYLLGDAVHHPLQLNDTGISFLSDSDAEHALKTREELLDRLAGRDVVIGMDHFPGSSSSASPWARTDGPGPTPERCRSRSDRRVPRQRKHASSSCSSHPAHLSRRACRGGREREEKSPFRGSRSCSRSQTPIAARRRHRQLDRGASARGPWRRRSRPTGPRTSMVPARKARPARLVEVRTSPPCRSSRPARAPPASKGSTLRAPDGEDDCTSVRRALGLGWSSPRTQCWNGACGRAKLLSKR